METNSNLPQLPVADSTEQLFSNQLITVSYGIELVGDLYVPAGKAPFPAIVQITPYGTQSLAKIAEIYATRGYLFLAVDSCGRYRSAGRWQPMVNDQSDARDVINWLASHELCNGRVGTRGHCYCGYNQLLAAIDAPSALLAMVVCNADGDPMKNSPFNGGAFAIDKFFWLLNMTGRINDETFEAEYFGIKRFVADTVEFTENPYLETKDDDEDDTVTRAQKQKAEAQQVAIDKALLSRPLINIDLHFGVRLEQFREWLQHWQLDDYWKSRSAYARINQTAVPTLHMTGWWHNDLSATVEYYRAMRTQASSAVREKQRLFIGPWNHQMQAPDCSALPEDDATQIQRGAWHDELNDEFSWFDQYLMDITPGPSTAARVCVFLTGVYRWLEFDDWPVLDVQSDNYFLAAANNDTDTEKSGRLLPSQGASEGVPEDDPGSVQMTADKTAAVESSYRFDPQQPTPFCELPVPVQLAPFDNSRLQQTRDDMLLFDMSPQQEPLALLGQVSLVLFAYADVPDFDLCAKILDVHPDGRAIYLGDGIIRARFREGRQQAAFVVPGEINRYKIDLGIVGHVLRCAHRLRLEIASSAFRRFDVNACTDGEPATETRVQPATINIVHSAQWQSKIILPVCTDPRAVAGLS